VDSLPIYDHSQLLRYGRQIEPPDTFRLLWVEMLHGSEIFKNQDFRKDSSEKWGEGSIYKSTKIGHGEI